MARGEAMTNARPLLIDMVSDIVCPWCYVGLQSLSAACRSLTPEYAPRVRFRPFQLNPDTPAEGIDRAAYYAGKFPDAERLVAIRAAIVEAAKVAGFAFDPARPERLPNTLRAHEGLRAAQIMGAGGAFASALYAAYWNEDADLSNPERLADLARAAGLDAGAFLKRLLSGADRDAVRADAEAMRKAGVSGVPTFIVNERQGFSGALPPEELAAALRRAARISVEMTQ
jgi:predicted DsbA family dithiol-disulfide isomerase